MVTYYGSSCSNWVCSIPTADGVEVLLEDAKRRVRMYLFTVLYLVGVIRLGFIFYYRG